MKRGGHSRPPAFRFCEGACRIVGRGFDASEGSLSLLSLGPTGKRGKCAGCQEQDDDPERGSTHAETWMIRWASEYYHGCGREISRRGERESHQARLELVIWNVIP